ncbi:MAG: hypothetical protein GY756_00140, partial [bacterium]|nr:hypothetical protein [bacterium]
NGNDIMGFNGFPAGYDYDGGGSAYVIGTNLRFWTSTQCNSSDESWYIYMSFSDNEIHKNGDFHITGKSVRCIKDSI